VVEEMNQTAELRSRTGGLQYRFADGETIVVTKESIPRLDVTIHLRTDSIDVDSRLVVRGPDAMEREAWESLAIDVDKGRSSLRNAKGEVFTVDQAVYYILRPFLHLGTSTC
jgi:antitoxin (DNA-binding transcriptional repressor) of toxin-antitoxin stability system